MSSSFPRLRDFVPEQLWPSDILDAATEDGTSLLDLVAVESLDVSRSGGSFTLSLSLAVDQEISVELPGTGGMRLVFGSSDGLSFTVTATIGENVSIAITDLPIALRFPEGWFTPADDAEHAEIGVTASISATFTSGEEPSITFSLGSSVSFGPFYIGSSGILVEGDGIQFDFDRASNPVELTPGTHYPDGGVFLGVIIASARVSFPSVMSNGDTDTAEFSITNAIIGTGGFTGEVAFSGTQTLKLAGAAFTITGVTVSLTQNVLTNASIAGTLALPVFEQDVDVDLSFDMEGNFSVLVSGESGLVTIELDGLATLEIDQLGLQVTDDLTEVILGGKLDLEAQPASGTITWPDVTFSDLRVRSDGTIYAPEGAIKLDEEAGIDIFGFKIAVSAIGFGTTDEGRTFVSLSGGISINEKLPIGVSADGLMVSWANGESGPTDIQFSLGGIGLEFTVPDAFSFRGYVALDLDNKRFTGSLDLTIDPIDLAISADLVAGIDGSGTKYWYLGIAVDLPVPIPLGATSLGIFGFEGIVTGNMAPNRTADQDWYEDWYKASPMGINSSKFDVEAGALGVGAGMTFGVLPNGFALAAKGLFLITFPGPIIFLEGRASVLRDRSELSTGDPPFSALMVADVGAGTFQLSMGADLSLYEVIDIAGDSTAFYDFNDFDAWYLNIGNKPEEERIRATALSLLQANAYLTVDASGIETGGGMQLGGSWEFGPAAVTASVIIDAAAGIAFRPEQFYGRLAMEAAFGISVCGFGVQLSATASAEGQSPDPFHVLAEFALTVGLPSPLEDLELDLSFEWEEGDTPVPEDPLARVSFSHPLSEATWSPGDDDLVSGETASYADLGVRSAAVRVPCDARPVIQLVRPMADTAKVADNDASVTTSGTEQVGKSRIARDILSVKLYKWADASGSSPPALVSDSPASGDGVLYGCWLATVEGGSAFAGATDTGSGVSSTQLMIWGRNPFEVSASQGTLFDAMVAQGYPCPEEPDAGIYEWGWTMANEAIVSPVVEEEVTVTITSAGSRGVLYRPPMDPVWNHFALAFLHGDVVVLTLPVPAANVEIHLSLATCDVQVEYDAGAGWEVHSVETPIGDRAVFIEAPNIVAVRLTAGTGTGSDCAWFYGLRYQSQTGADAVAVYKDGMDREAAAVTRWSSEADIFEPNSFYFIEVTTKVTVTTGGSSDSKTFTSVFQFQTYGPPGSFGETGDDVGGPLDSLDLYFAAAAPGPDSHPHYRTYGLTVAFNRDYVGELYDGDLLLRLYDENGQELTAADGSELVYYGDAPPEISYTSQEAAWVQALEECDCLESTVKATPFAAGSTYTASNSALSLLPSRTYTVAIIGAGEEVYRYTFVTSAYESLAAHVSDRLDTVFDLPVGGTVSLSDLDDLLSNDGVLSDGDGVIDRAFDPTTEQAGFEGALSLLDIGARAPVGRVDVSLVASETRRYAVLVESPEPFPFERLRLTLKEAASATDALVPVSAWRVLRRADGTAMLLFVDDGANAAGDVPAKFYSLELVLLGDISDQDESALVWALPAGASEESTTLTVDLT